MTAIKTVIDLFLHLDRYLTDIIGIFGAWSYILLFLVIFCETGLVVTPFLPGDSLLFAAGALAAGTGAFNIVLLWLVMIAAAFLGDTANYWIGHTLGERAFDPNFRFNLFGKEVRISKVLKPEYLHKAQAFYEKHGGKAIILARFVPIVRTFAPFVAGVSKMTYGKFLSFNAIGGAIWVTLFIWGGYLFGNLPIIKNNFHYSVVIIILISLVPIALEMMKAKREAKTEK